MVITYSLHKLGIWVRDDMKELSTVNSDLISTMEAVLAGMEWASKKTDTECRSKISSSSSPPLFPLFLSSVNIWGSGDTNQREGTRQEDQDAAATAAACTQKGQRRREQMNMFDESLVTLHSFTPWLQLISDDGQALASIHANVTKSARIITKKILPRLWTAMSHLKDDTGGAGGAGIVLTHSHARALGNHAGRELGLRIWNAMAELMWTGENWMEEREEREWEHEEWTEARDADEEEFMRKFWESTGLPDWEKGFETWKAFNITE